MKRFNVRSSRRAGRARDPATWAWLAPAAATWAAGVTLAWSAAGPRLAAPIAALGAVSIAAGLAAWRRRERDRWISPVKALGRSLSAFNDEPGETWDLPGSPALSGVVGPIRDLQSRFLALRAQLAGAGDDPGAGDSGEMAAIAPIDARMTRSGSFEPPSGLASRQMATGEFSSLDMISRLDPRTFRWLESSQAEQEFLGWSQDQLRGKSFLEIVQEDDRRLARQQLKTAVARGEGHGLIYRITTARGETRAVELNVGARYAPDHRVLHLRCHLADVTAKLRDENELKRRTKELIQANDELRRTNRELEELKDRYGDLYQNAPAMYFTVDRRGRFLECNDTLLRTLGLTRKDVLGRPATVLLAPGRVPTPADEFLEVRGPGPFEFESEWARQGGGSIEVWVTGTAVLVPEAKGYHYRCVAKDITARRVLEAELQVKNERLALANAELSRKNKELDEFTYVVSHDLQEPLRTLIAFSDFLMRDQGDRLDETGKEYVRYLVEASRRLRSLIQALLTLSRAGKVTAEFAVVDLDEVVEVLKADHAELIRSKNAEVRVLGPLPLAWGDRDRIGQLAANLVGNGLKYNRRPDPIVEIGAKVDETSRRLVLSVRDNGIGIDPQFHSKIFQLFRRLHTREEYEGTGAGLAICQKIAQAHGGKIWVQSEPEQGSTFFVTLPTPPAGLAAKRTETLHAP